MKKAANLFVLTAVALLGLQGIALAQQGGNAPPAFVDELEMNRAFISQIRADPFIIYDSTELIALIESNMAAYHIPGVAVCVVKDSQIVWTRNFGYANLERSIPVADTTLFVLASISKTFVANAAMQLWEDGLLDLDADVNGYIPFSVVNPYYPDSIITMRMLLTHTSSIDRKDETWAPDIVWDYDHPTPIGQYLEDYLDPGGANYAPTNYLMYPPGTFYRYSNYAFALAGYIIEQIVVGSSIASSFEQYCQNSLFAPLGMDETSWFLANLDTNNIAVQYDYSGGYVRYGFATLPLYPAGQLRTSSIQLARHLMAFMLFGELNGNRILDSSTVALMMTDQFPDVPTEDPDGVMQGIGWYKLFNEADGWQYWGHNGGLTGCRTWMLFRPDEGSGIVELTNGNSSDGSVNILNALAGFARDPELDGIVGGLDNCPYDYNPDQDDADSDGIGDVCDNCLTTPNTDQANNDLDTLGDACDNCPDSTNTDQMDADQDGWGDVCDNCPDDYNPGQGDADQDGTGDVCEYICGDADGDSSMNMLDILYLIAYLYKGGPTPDPLESADVDSSSSVNMLDILYLIAYLYKGGPEPVCP
jgi:CubicO group peptidase (beta-lactamase class C family)